MDEPQPHRLLRKLKLYQTKAKFYLVGCTGDKQNFRICKFSRLEECELQASDDPALYTEAQCKRLLSSIHAGNKAHGGLSLVLEADALIGCFRFVEGYYLLFVTQKNYIGSICGTDKIYSVGNIRLVALHTANELGGREEQRYRKMLSGIELTKNFFFSYTWPVWRTVQATLASAALDSPWDSMFVWNDYLTRPLRSMVDAGAWVTPLIHGHWQQRTLALATRTLTISIIARRSRHFAGTRYRKRGTNDQGHVANDVETEQVVSAGVDARTGYPIISSVVQVRGSIPLFWTQDYYTQRRLKPDIALQRFDPLYDATRLHFQSLFRRYGHPIVVLSLLKMVEKQPRERILGKEFENAINFINRKRPVGERVLYVPWDFKRCAKRRGSRILSDIAPTVKRSLDLTGLFVCAPASATKDSSGAGQKKARVSFQRGVLRTNCLDCLDRTNVAQFALGLHALGLQLHALGISESPALDMRSSLAIELMNLFEQMGNVLAKQYGGSEAHTAIFKRQRGDWELPTSFMDKLTSLRRFYNNTYTDSEKQDAMNLFLGNYVPMPGQPAIWQLDSDYYLHSGLGQRFLRRFLAKAEEADSEQPGGVGTPIITSPSIPSGHLQGEGVRNYAALVAEAIAEAGLRSAEGSSHGGSRHSNRASERATDVDRARRSGELLPSTLESKLRALQAKQGESEMHGSRSSQALASVHEEDTGHRKLDGPNTRSQPRKDEAQPSSAPPPPGPHTHPAAPIPNAEPGMEPARILSTGETLEEADPAWSGEAPQGEAVEPYRLPCPEVGSGGGDVLPGMHRFKALSRHGGRPKLESFDRKLGRQPNAVLQVALNAPPSGSTSFLPQWLAFPLGFTNAPSHRHTPLATPFATPQPSRSDLPPHIPQILHTTSLPTQPWSLEEAPPAAPLQRGNSLDVPLPSREEGVVEARLQPAGSERLIPRSRSETGREWDREVVRQTIQEAVAESIGHHADVGVASPPIAYPPFASEGRGLNDGFGTAFSLPPSEPPEAPTSSKELAEGIISALLSASATQEHLEMSALLAERPWDESLGMAPGVLCWWVGQPRASKAWEREAAIERAAYSKYIRNAQQLGSQGGYLSETRSEYEKLCSGFELQRPAMVLTSAFQTI